MKSPSGVGLIQRTRQEPTSGRRADQDQRPHGQEGHDQARQGGDGADALRAPGPSHGREDDDDQDVLDQEDPDGQTAVGALHLPGPVEELHDDGRAAEGRHQPDHEGGLRRKAQEGRQARRETEGQRDLDGPRDQHRATERPQLLEAQLQADDEEQEGHAQLGEEVEGLRYPEESGDGTQHQARDDVREDGRDPEGPAGDEDGSGADEDQPQVVEDGIGCHGGEGFSFASRRGPRWR